MQRLVGALSLLVLAIPGCIDWEDAESGFCVFAELEERPRICGLPDPTASETAPPLLTLSALGGAGDDALVGIVAAAGGPVIAGNAGPGFARFTVEGPSDGFLMRALPDGTVQTLIRLGGPGRDRVVDLAPAPDGSLLLLTESEGPAWLGEELFPGEGRRAVLTVLDPGLQPLRSVVLAPGEGSQLSVTEVTASGSSIAIAGQLSGTITVGGATLSAEPQQAFAVVLDEALTHSWHVVSLGCTEALPSGIALDEDGALALSGFIFGTGVCDLPGGFGGANSAADQLTFLTFIPRPEVGAEPASRWSVSALLPLTPVTADSIDYFAPGDLMIDGGRVSRSSPSSAAPHLSLIRVWNTEGLILDAFQWGHSPDQALRARLSTTAQGVFGLGEFEGLHPAFGLEMEGRLGKGAHGFVRFVPEDPALGWARIFEGPGSADHVRVNAVTTDADGRVWVVGEFAGRVSTSGIERDAAGGSDGFVAVLGGG